MQTRKREAKGSPPAVFALNNSEAQFQRELDNARGLAYRNDRSGRRCRCSCAAYPSEGWRSYACRAFTRVARVLVVHMVERVEGFDAELQSHSLGDDEVLERSEI